MTLPRSFVPRASAQQGWLWGLDRILRGFMEEVSGSGIIGEPTNSRKEPQMNRFLTAAVLSLSLSAGAALASGFEDSIRSAYEAAGYTNVDVQQVDGQWIVSADVGGASRVFVVDAVTGQSTDITGTEQANAQADGKSNTNQVVDGNADTGDVADNSGDNQDGSSADDNSGSSGDNQSASDNADTGDVADNSGDNQDGSSADDNSGSSGSGSHGKGGKGSSD